MDVLEIWRPFFCKIFQWNRSTMSKTSIFVWPYFLMLLVGLIFPSDGNHGLLSPKSLAFLAAFFSIGGYFLLHQRLSLYQLKCICFGLLATSFLLIWYLFGLFFSYETQSISAMDQLKLFAITVAVVLMTLYVVSENLVSPQKVLRVVIFGNFIYSLMKLTLVTLHVLQVIDLWGLLETIGIRFMSMLIVEGMARLQTSVDIITPFLLFFVLQSDSLHLQLSKKFRFLYAMVSIFSIFLSFSRFLIMIGILSFILHWLCLKGLRVLKWLAIFLFFISLGAYFAGTENIVSVFEQRFLSDDNSQSDQTRVEQTKALIEAFRESPYLGIGMGGIAQGTVRDHVIQHSYEVQWLAFLMQFGIMGLFFLIIPLVMISSHFIFSSFSKIKWCFFILFLFWLLSGFTNPFLISLTSGIVYSIFLLAGRILSRNFELSGVPYGKEGTLSQSFLGGAIQNKNRLASGGYISGLKR